MPIPQTGGNVVPVSEAASAAVALVTTGAFFRLPLPIVTRPEMFATYQIVSVRPQILMMATDGTDITNIKLRLVDSEDTELATFEFPQVSLTSNIIKVDAIVTVPLGATSTTRAPWAWIVVTDLDSGTGMAISRRTLFVTDEAFTWPTDGQLKLAIATVGTDVVYVPTIFTPITEKHIGVGA